MPYLLDANVFIQAKNLHYGMDFCPAFWDWLIEGNAAKQVFSIEKVGNEILANYYLVAHAFAHGHTVVTHEIASTSTKKIKIPDACIGLGIKCVTPYEMLRKERARFILGPTP